MCMEHAWKGLETVLPGICFTVVFSSNNILKELPTSNPGVQKNKAYYRAQACAVKGCTGCIWPPTRALCHSLCGKLHHRGARAQLQHHGTSTGTSTWLSLWTAFSPAVHRTLLTHCRNCPHISAELMLSLGRTALLWPVLGCLRDKNQTVSIHRIDILCHPTLKPGTRSLPGLSPPHSQGILLNRPEVFTGLKRERENYTNAGAFYSTLSQPPTCLHHWWSIRHTLTDQRRGNGNLLLKYCHGVALQKHNQELEIYRACSKYDTSQIKLMHTTKFFLNPLSLLIPHALYSVWSLIDLFPSVISKEQMGVLHIHSPLSSVKTSPEYLWPPVHSSSLMF